MFLLDVVSPFYWLYTGGVGLAIVGLSVAIIVLLFILIFKR